MSSSRLLVALLLGIAAHSARAEQAAADVPEPEPAAEEPAAEEPVVLNCDGPELIEPMDTWSVDCVAQWLENMGFGDLKTAFMGNRVNGSTLAELTMEKLADEYGVSEEDNRKTLIYALKDIVRKDNYKGNTNNWAEFFMWILPFLGVYKWLTMRYERQIAKLTKKYRKWQEARNPPEPVAPVVAPDGLSEWISGMNSDMPGGEKDKKPKKAKEEREKKSKKAE